MFLVYILFFIVLDDEFTLLKLSYPILSYPILPLDVHCTLHVLTIRETLISISVILLLSI